MNLRALFLLIVIAGALLPRGVWACGDDTLAHITTARGKTITLWLEAARTPEAQIQGLMKRKALAPYDGMAFFFSTPAPQKFWMKDTVVPLDIIFVNAEKKIIAISKGKPLSETPVGPDTPVSSVMEIAAGHAKKMGIAVGDSVTYETPAKVQYDNHAH